MKSLLRAIYSGDFRPAERHPPRRADYETLRRWLTEDLGSFAEKLSPEDAKRLREFSEQRNHLGAMEDEDSFVTAFAAGARLMAEVFLADSAREE